MASDVPEPTQVDPLSEDHVNNKLFPFSELALLAFLKAASQAAITGITILNIYSATCVLAWSKVPTNIVMKTALVELPFSILPILFIIRSIVKVAEKSGCGLSVAATLVLSEFIYVYVIGGVTIAVMSRASKIVMASVTVLLICIIVKLWGCISNHPKCLTVNKSDRVDLKNCLGVVSGCSVIKANKAKTAAQKLELVPNDHMLANSIKNSLNICFVLYLVFYIGFMLSLAVVAEKWWHALLGIAIMSSVHISGLYLIFYLRDGLIRVHTMGRPNIDADLGCKLLASEEM